MVGGVREGMFLKHLWEFVPEGQRQLVCRSDSNAARSLASRLGIGKAKHIAANLLRLKEKVARRTVKVKAIASPKDVNVPDMGTNNLLRRRMESPKFLALMVSWNGERLGSEELQALQQKERMRKQVVSAVKHLAGNAQLAVFMAVGMVMASNGEELCRLEHGVRSWHDDWLFSLMWISLFVTTLLGALSLAWVIVVVLWEVREAR